MRPLEPPKGVTPREAGFDGAKLTLKRDGAHEQELRLLRGAKHPDNCERNHRNMLVWDTKGILYFHNRNNQLFRLEFFPAQSILDEGVLYEPIIGENDFFTPDQSEEERSLGALDRILALFNKNAKEARRGW